MPGTQGNDQIHIFYYATHVAIEQSSFLVVWGLTKFSGPSFHFPSTKAAHVTMRDCAAFHPFFEVVFLAESGFPLRFRQSDFILFLALSLSLYHLLGKRLCGIISYSGRYLSENMR